MEGKMFKMQSVVSVEDKLSVLPKEIFRRRLKIEETMRKSTARCLFGVPDPIESQNFVTQVYESSMMDFETKWNWDLTLGEPLTFPDEIPKKTEDGVESVKSETYYWNEVLEADVMAQANLHRFDVPETPNTRPVTLLFAPTNPSLVGLGFVPFQKKDAMSEHQNSEILATKSLSSGQVQHGHDSSSGVLSTSKDASISRKETRLSPPPMKQRCITDYMRVKKSQQGRKSMR